MIARRELKRTAIRDMASHMKTTVHIPDALLAEAQQLAAKEKTTLKALVAEGLRAVVHERKTRKPFKLEDGSVGGNGLQPEWQDASWDEIRAAAYGLPRK
jgi:Arc/MetJ family transcription regulator